MEADKIIEQTILEQIFLIRGEKVMIDFHLAELYRIETKQLKRQVRRNIERFPEDFMFELTHEEYNSLRSQFGTLKRGEHSKYIPMVFTENGGSMLSSVLNSVVAIRVNIQIMRTFTKIRKMLADNTELRLDIERIKTKLDNHDKNIEVVFQYLDELVERKPPGVRKPIGYKPDELQ